MWGAVVDDEEDLIRMFGLDGRQGLAGEIQVQGVTEVEGDDYRYIHKYTG